MQRRSFWADEHGTTSVEYTVVLTAITLSILGVGFFYMPDNVFNSIAVGIDGQIEQPSARNNEAREEPQGNFVAPRRENYARNATPLLMLCLTTGLGGWVIWQRRLDARNGDPDSHERIDDAMPERLQARFVEKRRRIHSFLMRDLPNLEGAEMLVGHLMTPKVLSVSPKTPVDELVAMMKQKKIRHLLVAKNGHLKGIISDRDCHTRQGKKASDIMTRNPVTVSPITPATMAVTMMLDRHISSLPVVDGDELCGVLSTSDLMMALQCHLRLAAHLAREINGESLLPV